MSEIEALLRQGVDALHPAVLLCYMSFITDMDKAQEILERRKD